MDILEALKFFGHVAQRGSISSAARAKGLSTTAASKKLQDLEAKLGMRLVDRTTRSLALTEAGRQLLARSTMLIDQLDDALASVRDLQDTPCGTLRIVSRRWYGIHVVSPLLPAFRLAYPRVVVDIELTEEVDVVPGNGIDLVITLGRPNDKSIVAHQLTTNQRWVAGSPAYFRRAGVPQVPADLSSHDCLIYQRVAESAAWVFEVRKKPVTVKVQGPITSNSGDVLMRAALDGMGLVLLPEYMTAREVASGQLVVCLERYKGFQQSYVQPAFLLHRRGHLPAKSEAFVSFLLQHQSPRFDVSRKSGK
jgi:DNA-binding transcriptional LysR family regulator